MNSAKRGSATGLGRPTNSKKQSLLLSGPFGNPQHLVILSVLHFAFNPQHFVILRHDINIFVSSCHPQKEPVCLLSTRRSPLFLLGRQRGALDQEERQANEQSIELERAKRARASFGSSNACNSAIMAPFSKNSRGYVFVEDLRITAIPNLNFDF